MTHSQDIRDVDNIGEIKTWLKRRFIPFVFPSKLDYVPPADYDDETGPHVPWGEDGGNRSEAVAWDPYIRRTTPITVRQIRSKTKPCAPRPATASVTKRCAA